MLLKFNSNMLRIRNECHVHSYMREYPRVNEYDSYHYMIPPLETFTIVTFMA